MIYYDSKEIKQITDKAVLNARLLSIGYSKYVRIPMGYDTETTRLNKHSYVYHFCVTIGKKTIGFRTWSIFLEWLQYLNHKLDRKYRNNKITPRLIIWVANLSFEFQFLKDRAEWKVFATNSRQPLTADYGKYIQVREALKISGGSLAYLAKN